jgi:hypothetical protein
MTQIVYNHNKKTIKIINEHKNKSSTSINKKVKINFLITKYKPVNISTL